MSEATFEQPLLRLSESRDAREELRRDAREGLTGPAKSLPPKYLYDARGSALFERITTLPEYYPTRCETQILEQRADEILERVRPDELLEIGSGSSTKTRLLLEAMHRTGGETYVAFDVSEEAIRMAEAHLRRDYPWLCVQGVLGDLHSQLHHVPRSGRRLVCFLGSTIGNLEPEERRAFLVRVGELLEPGDRFLLGVDLVKDPRVIEAAYNDASGVTAQFTHNLLTVLNRELDGNLPLDAFEHVATFDAEHSWVEIRLRARRAVDARLAAIDLDVHFDAGEELRTEVSSKFTRESVEDELAGAGLVLEEWHTDERGYFGVALASRR